MPHINAADVTLAQLSLDAYSDTAALPTGFIAPPLALSPTPGVSYSNGSFHAGSGAALVSTGLLNGEQTLVVAFRGSDDAVDSRHDLGGINGAYADFAPLVQAVDAYAASGAVQQVVVTGHSLGGAMAQLYMATHPDQPGGPAHEAVTFGSPGAQLAAAPDARIDNLVIADDPAVLLGVHRAEVGAVLAANPALAQAAAQQAALEFPGLTAEEALASLPLLTSNYVNRGDLTLLPAADGRLDPSAALHLDPAEHDMALYLARTTAAAAGTGPSLDVPQQPLTAMQALDRAVYAGDTSAIGSKALVDAAVANWPQAPHALDQAGTWLSALHHDLPFG